ncbi:MAG: outer membrane lipoprotein carrier protein LolA [Bacteroidales bacterium]|nr:outer membrane lipoprotein carrier protein LolA [Bacteroidales bacterium]
MRKHIQIIAGILLLLASNAMMGQDKASELVNNLSKSLKKHKNTEVIFTYQSPGSSEAKDGQVFLQNDAYKIILEEQHTISDGNLIWTYLVEEEEMYISKVDENSDSPVQLFTDLEKESTPKLKGTDANGNTVIELYDNRGNSMDITLKFDKKGDLKRLEMQYEEGTLVFNITDIKFDLDFEDGFFAFDEKAYPNVDIIDMR